MKPIFYQIWADKFWGIRDIFGRFISPHFGTASPCLGQTIWADKFWGIFQLLSATILVQ
jgi:hypothetical protein